MSGISFTPAAESAFTLPTLNIWTASYVGPLTSSGEPQYYDSLTELGDYSTVYALSNGKYAQTYPQIKCPSFGTVTATDQGPSTYMKSGQYYSRETGESGVPCAAPIPDSGEKFVGLQEPVSLNSCQKYSCIYQPSDFAFETEAVGKWYSEYGWDDRIMAAYCKQPGEVCPLSSGTYPTCSRFVSQGTDGELCRAWADSSSAAAAVSDELMRDWADQHTNSYFPLDERASDPTCLCINKTKDPTYNQLKAYARTANDGCWYEPCMPGSATQYLIPSSERQVDSGSCSDVCQQFLVLGDDVTVSDSELDVKLGCGYSRTDGADGTDGTDDGSGSESGSGLSSKAKTVVVVSGVGAALLMMGIGFGIFKKK